MLESDNKKKLPKHLKLLAKRIDSGKDIHGKPLSDSKRRSIAKMLGAGKYRSKSGRIKKVNNTFSP